MSAPFRYYFSKERRFAEKRGALIRGRRSLNISRQKVGANANLSYCSDDIISFQKIV